MTIEYFASLNNKIRQISRVLSEGTNREEPFLPHFEDCVINSGTKGIDHALKVAKYMVRNPGSASIKYDGKVGLIFGCGTDRKFTVCDKWMFKNGRGRVHSPQEFVQYDQQRGANRTDLHQTIASIWNGLLQDYGNNTGYYFGDLMSGSPLTENGGEYNFKGNNRGINYSIRADSDIGKFLKNKRAFIIVHQYLDPTATNTKQAVSLNGTIGNLKNLSDVAIVGSTTLANTKLSLNNALVSKITNDTQKMGTLCDDLLRNPEMTGVLSRYINSKVRSGNLSNLYHDFVNFKVNDETRQWIQDHRQGVIALFTLWSNLYKLKMDLWGQMQRGVENHPIQAKLDDGRPMQEGFVCGGYKFINRANGFSRQNLNNQ